MVNLYSRPLFSNGFWKKKSPEPISGLSLVALWLELYLMIIGRVVVAPAFMRTMYWPFGMSARLNM